MGTGIDVEDEQDISEESKRRNQIANEMWRQYQEVLCQRSQDGLDIEESDDSEDSDEENDNSDDDFYV